MTRRARDATFSAGGFIALAVAAPSGYHGAQHLPQPLFCAVWRRIVRHECSFFFFLTSLSFCITFNTVTLHMCKFVSNNLSNRITRAFFFIVHIIIRYWGDTCKRCSRFKNISFDFFIRSTSPALVYYVRADAAGDDTTKDIQRNCSDCKKHCRSDRIKH